MPQNSFGAKDSLRVGDRDYEIFRLDALQKRFDVARLPFSLKVLLENLLRTEGNGSVDAADIEALASWDAKAEPGKEIAFTPARVLMQDFTGVPAVVDLAANVRLPLDLAGVPTPTSRARVADALGRVGLADFSRHFPRQLSGGMKMRVSIARSLVTDPDLLLMDEPFGALDEFTRNRLDDDLTRLAFERKLTTVFVTHSIYEAVFLSSRIVVMAAGPGRIFASLAIDEPQPRREAFRNSPRFGECCRDLSALLAQAADCAAVRS